jgi:predicted secreted protein
MRLALIGTVAASALMIASASAQAPKISGTKAFCLKQANSVECAYDTMAACEKGVKDKSPAGAGAPTCVTRSDASR